METTVNGVIKATSIEIYNVDPFNNNATILDEHLGKVASESTLGHIKIGTGLKMVDEVANVKIANDLMTDDSSTALSAEMGVELNTSIVNTNSKLADHVDKVASETTLGHIKIGTGLKMTDDIASIKIANDLVTEDATTALSAGMGVKLNEKLEEHMEKVATDSELGHIKIGTGLQMADDVANVKIANNLTTNDTSTALSAAMGVELSQSLNNTTQTLSSAIQDVENQLPARPLSQKGFVDDCLQDTVDAGYYQYYFTANNKPSDADGIVISVPWFEKTDTWHNKFSFRLAIDINGNLYTSVYKEGISWGEWNIK